MKRNVGTWTCAVITIAFLSWVGFAVAGIEDPPLPTGEEVDPVPATAASGTGMNYTTGFEVEEGFPVGYISNTPASHPVGCGGVAFPCWGHTTTNSCSGGPGPVCSPSLLTPTIESIHPAIGVQHLRLAHDPTTRTNIPNYGLGVDARYPRNNDTTARPVAPNTVSLDVAISDPLGQNFSLQVYSNSQALPASYMAFYNDGSIWVLDDLCGTVGVDFMYTGAYWDTTGGYQNATIAMDPCDDTINYYYAGSLIYTGCVYGGSNLESVRLVGDNFPGSHMDVDSFSMQSEDECPSVCGNGFIETPNESCEPGNQPNGCNPGHTCGAIGGPGECQCNRICTLAEPCLLANGANGPYMGPFDAQFGAIFTYDAPAGVDAVSVELCGSTGIDTNILYWGSVTDPGDPGSANDDCCDPADPNCGSFGNGSDASASCYNNVGAPNYESCTCHNNPLPGDNSYLLQLSGGNDLDARFLIEVNKKAACGQGHLGACCDTNGADQGCTDNVLSGACTGGPDKIWTENGKCATVACDCIPDCNGATCGSDGCGGSCGTCGDGNVCNGEETCGPNRTCLPGPPLVCNDNNICNGLETCDPATGCHPGTPLNCNDGLACTGQETCNPSSGCVAGTPVNCDDELECTVDACNEPDGSCTNDDANCSIPTVSEWGLVVLTLALLIAGKAFFGLRRPDTA